MKQQVMAYVWLKLWGLAVLALSIGAVLILAEPQRLAYFSLLLFKHQEILKTSAIFGIFIGAFFLFYTSSKIPEKYVSVKLFKGSMKMHPDVIKQTLEQWFLDQDIHNMKIASVTINQEQSIGLEIRTSNIDLALFSLEDVEMKLKEFMGSCLGIQSHIDVDLFEG